MKNIFGAIFLLILAGIGYGQNFQTEFHEYLGAKDTINQLKVLTEWEQTNPKDPELFTSYFNYHFSRSRKELITLTTEEPIGKHLALEDSLDETVGYLGSQIYYDLEELQKGFERIDDGIRLYPNRLDMRFGKIYALGETKDWESFTSEIIETVTFSAFIDNNWTWEYGEELENGEAFFLEAMQDYQLRLFNTGSDELLVNMREIANEILKFYPDHIESLSNLSITYLLTQEYDHAIEILLRVEKLVPEDPIILSNIAYGYLLEGDKDKAIEYYEKTARFGDDRLKAVANQQIEELKK